ncbi:MAG: chromosomal replication initiator protein DnaA, partial [Planctomycetes bacterium]|nr:chromosomal replication initiator protein DnaA [Planctomycetota bacterium]
MDRELLHALLQQLATRVKREQLETWFRSLNVARIDDSDVELSVTSQFVRDWLQRSYLGVLQEAVQALGGPQRRVILTQREEDDWDSLQILSSDPRSEESIPGQLAPGQNLAPGQKSDGYSIGHQVRARMEGIEPARPMVPSTPAPQPAGPSFRRRAPSQLNPNYTFDKFVVGSCNQFAHASSLATGENPGCAFNPLFVHGNVGLGKTHLLQAICHTVQKRDPNARVFYLSCEDFTNAYIQAIQNHEIDAFREFYRSADMLVIDDVQFLANKDKTQDEFFHTFNALYDAQKQIVLSSDRPAAEIPTIEERLVSRFKWGMVAEVQAPALETRAAIVRRKAKGRGV